MPRVRSAAQSNLAPVVGANLMALLGTSRVSTPETAQAKDYDALAAAHSRAVARLSRDIADAVRALASAP